MGNDFVVTGLKPDLAGIREVLHSAPVADMCRGRLRFVQQNAILYCQKNTSNMVLDLTPNGLIASTPQLALCTALEQRTAYGLDVLTQSLIFSRKDVMDEL